MREHPLIRQITNELVIKEHKKVYNLFMEGLQMVASI